MTEFLNAYRRDQWVRVTGARDSSVILHSRVTVDHSIYCIFQTARKMDFENFCHKEMINGEISMFNEFRHYAVYTCVETLHSIPLICVLFHIVLGYGLLSSSPSPLWCSEQICKRAGSRYSVEYIVVFFQQLFRAVPQVSHVMLDYDMLRFYDTLKFHKFPELTLRTI